jgi:hypothetical protein
MSRPFPHRCSRLAAVLSVVFLFLVTASRATADPTGFLYSATGSPLAGGSAITQFEVAADTSLHKVASVPAGPIYGGDQSPGALVMAKTADGENLYQLSSAPQSHTAATIYQYSVDPTTGAVSAKSPASVGQVPTEEVAEPNLIAVFNPAANGEAGQNALYVVSTEELKLAKIYVFDIDATTGALTPAGAVEVPGLGGGYLGVAGNALVIGGGGAFDRARIGALTGVPEFEPGPTEICEPETCGFQFDLLNPDQMLTGSLHIQSGPVQVITATHTAYVAGAGWGELGTSTGQGEAWGEIVNNGHQYLALEGDYIQPYDPDGLAEAYTSLEPGATDPTSIFALGEGVYVSTLWPAGYYCDGLAYRFATGAQAVQTPLSEELGVAMTGFLLGGSAGGGGGSTGGSSGSPPPGSPPPVAATAGKSGAKKTATLAPPKTKILAVKITGATATMKFHGSGGVGKLTFRCHFGGTKKSVSCSSPLVRHHLAAGTHHFSVDAVDSRGVADPTPAQTTFTTK